MSENPEQQPPTEPDRSMDPTPTAAVDESSESTGASDTSAETGGETEASPPRESNPPLAAETPPATYGLAMKHRNIWAVWIGLPLITLGIYGFVWYYKIHKEMAEFDPRRSIPVAGPMLVLLFLGWTVIAPLISYHNTGVRVRNAQMAAGVPQTCSPAASWLLAFVLGLNFLYLQNELNKVVDHYQGVSAGSRIPLFA